ncbi:MAG: 3'-5' exonuclease domain-containing protein 2 [Coprobacter sp.]|nr:3'-5' exonuclease domain-containing protein 2 [Coprobacter sp.]
MIHIDKACIADMEIARFPGKIVVIDTDEKADAAYERLCREAVVGLDTETRPSFKKGVVHQVALVQISTWDTCYLFRLCKMSALHTIKRILESKKILKIGLSLKDDFHGLHRLDEIEPHHYIELQQFVAAYDIDEMSLQKVYAILFGRKISKSQQLSNWEAAELTPAQQQYAATDAWSCLHIYRALQGEHIPNIYPPVLPIIGTVDPKPFIQK